MIKLKVTCVLSVLLILSFCVALSYDVPQEATEDARLIPKWSYEKLMSESDVVAIIEPLENVLIKDTFPGDEHDLTKEKCVPMETRFRVHTTLKGVVNSVQQLTVLHFTYSESFSGPNDADFIHFLIGPLQYEKRIVKPGPPLGDVELGKVTVFGYQPIWLAFLIRRGDGRFEPTTGQLNPRLSFRELHEPSFYVTP